MNWEETRVVVGRGKTESRGKCQALAVLLGEAAVDSKASEARG